MSELVSARVMDVEGERACAWERERERVRASQQSTNKKVWEAETPTAATVAVDSVVQKMTSQCTK